jgi:hypothetical protein
MKSLLVYFIAVLMLCTSGLYFAVAIFGERIESGEAHVLQIVGAQTVEEAGEPVHNESEELTTEEGEVRDTHNESEESTAEQLKEAQEIGESNEHVEDEEDEEGTEAHQETASENQRKKLEFPLSVSAGAGYTIVGLWTTLDNKNRKIPYVIAIVGSLVLLGIYSASRTVGISSLGLEPVGLLDLIVAMLQGGIIVGSSYILTTKIYTIRE